MRRLLSWSGHVVALLLLAAVGRAQESATTTTAPPAQEPPAVQETTVDGTPPDLAGRWLVVTALELPEGQHNTLPALWEISSHDGKPTLTQRFVALPPTQAAAVEQRGAEGQAWSPTPDDLTAIRSAWDNLQPQDAHVKSVRHNIAGKDGFDQTLTNEARTRDAIWVIRQRHDMYPSAAPVVRHAFVFAALAASDGGYTGNFDGATVAAAPFPIPISVKGSFRLYRLDEPASSAGVIRRLLDFFRGCGMSRQ
jgi:hypothetical protein